MQKFKHHPPKSRFNNYFLNAPANTRKQQRMHTEPSPNTNTTKTGIDQNAEPSALLQINSKMSIRSSREREKSGRIERKEVINRQITKDTLRRMRRFNTQQREGHQQKQMASLKRSVNEMNLVCNSVKKADALPLPAHSTVENYARQERRKFLMGQVCFTEIDQQRILSQQHYLKQFQHLRASLPKMLQADIAHSHKAHEAHILACLRWIDRLFMALQQMEFAGYQLKNNRFLIEYCLAGRMWLKRVLLTESQDKKDAFSMAVKYYVVDSAEKAKDNFTAYLAGGPSEGVASCLADLESLYDHMQASLTQKKLSKLINITSGLDTHAASSKGLKCLKRASEVNVIQGRLTQDLQQMESQFGPMREITRISRRKFDQLNRTYGRLQCLL